MSVRDLAILNQADADRQSSVRGWVRTGRRMVNRCWRDTDSIRRPRVFCQNSGACGSTYVVRLLQTNGIERAFHEKTPDLNLVGLQHYEQPMGENRLVRMLRYTRHDADFEANNRLFSLTRELAVAFPNSKYIHLHRDGTEAVRSAMSKPEVKKYLASNVRFAGALAGDHSLPPFDRFCHYWANVNRRIHNDLQYVQNHGYQVVQLRFENLIAGRVDPVETLLDRQLVKSTCEPANTGRVGQQGQYPSYRQWDSGQKRTFERVCGPVMAMLGR